MATELAVQDDFAHQRRRDWNASLTIGAACAALISVAFWYGEHGQLSDALGICVLLAGGVGFIAGTIIGIILSGIPHVGHETINIIAATCVNCGVYTVLTYAIIRSFRAGARRLSIRNNQE